MKYCRVANLAYPDDRPTASFCSSALPFAPHRYRVKHKAKQDQAARRILFLLRQPEHLLGAVLIGNTPANVYLGSLSATLIPFLGS